MIGMRSSLLVSRKWEKKTSILNNEEKKTSILNNEEKKTSILNNEEKKQLCGTFRQFAVNPDS